ncbi:unnamed protein product [Rotaria sp. Silwood2]|nr:unnamed protein product [Rotaria sp. Silwood2]
MGNCPTCLLEQANRNLDPQCYGKRKWKVFILSALITFFCGLAILLIYYKVQRLFIKRHRIRHSTKTKNFISTQNKLRFWLSLHSFVDLFTIPPSFMTLYLNRRFRFLRSLPMMNTSEILQYIGVIEDARTIRITQLASKFIAVWFAASGLVHLVENTGDFFCNYCNAQELDIFNAVYYMIVTMSTVGYGDISCKTYFGKFVVLVFLMSGLTQAWPWRDLYHRGAGMEMYLEEMSPSFYGKTYTESALYGILLFITVQF